MTAFPFESDFIASASCRTPAYPLQDTSASSKPHAEGGCLDERSDNKVGFFDIALPSAASVNSTREAARRQHARSCVIPAEKQSGTCAEASDECASGSSYVSMAQTAGADPGEVVDASGRLPQMNVINVVDRNEDEGPSALPKVRTYEGKDHRKEGSVGEIPPNMDSTSKQPAGFSQTNSRNVDDSRGETHDSSASSSCPAAPPMQRRTGSQQTVIETGEAVSRAFCGEEGVMKSESFCNASLGEGLQTEGDDEPDGMQALQRSAVRCVNQGNSHVPTAATPAEVGKTEDAEDVQTFESPIAAAGYRQRAGAPERETSLAVTAGAGQRGISHWKSHFFEESDAPTHAAARTEVQLRTRLPSYEDTAGEAACKPAQHAENLPAAETALKEEVVLDRSRPCEQHVLAVGADARPGRKETVKLQECSARRDGHGDEAELLALVTAPDTNCTRPALNAATQSYGEQGVSCAQEGAGSLVSSRRQLFERAVHVAREPHSPPEALFKQIDPVHMEGGHDEEEEVLVAAAGRVSPCGSLPLRKGSVIEKLREKYEKSTNGSSPGSTHAQPSSRSCALPTTPVGCEERHAELIRKQGQGDKLQAVQEAGEYSTATPVGAADGQLRSAPLRGSEQRPDLPDTKGTAGVIEKRPLAAGAAEESKQKIHFEHYKGGASAEDFGDPVQRSVVTAHGGERSAVTALKEKFERRKLPQKEEPLQAQQPHLGGRQQREQATRHTAEAAKLSGAQHERRKPAEATEEPELCPAVAPVVPGPPAAEKLSRSFSVGGERGEASVSEQRRGPGSIKTAATTPVSCLKEHYQRLLRKDAVSSSRESAPGIIVASTNVRRARDLLGTADIVGRYGKPYRMAKAEGALKSHECNADAAAVAMSTGQTPCANDGGFSGSHLNTALPGRDFEEREPSRPLRADAQGVKGVSEEISVPAAGAPLHGGHSRQGLRNLVDAWDMEGLSDAASTEERPGMCGSTATRRSGAETVQPTEHTCEPGTQLSHSNVSTSRGRPSPLVCAHASAKIGALASALGPACINFGKAPPRRLLTRPEPEDDAEKVDSDIYGYSKAQEAIERRKRELKLLAETTTSIGQEERDPSCVAYATQGFPAQVSASQNGTALGRMRDSTTVHAAAARKTKAAADVAPEKESRIIGSRGSPRKAKGCSGAEAAVDMKIATESANIASRPEAKGFADEYPPTVSAHVSSKIGALASALGPACMNFGKAPPRRLLARAEPDAQAERTDLDIYGYLKAQEAIERRKRELKLLAGWTTSDEENQGNASCVEDASKCSSLDCGASGNDLAPARARDRTGSHDAAARKKTTPADAAQAEGPQVSESRGSLRKAAGGSGADTAVNVESDAPPTAGVPRLEVNASKTEYSPKVSAHASSRIGALASALGPACMNYGKAPPRRLLARAEPAAEAQEPDIGIYGYSKAQEAIERRKRELQELAQATISDGEEQRGTRYVPGTGQGSLLACSASGSGLAPETAGNPAESQDAAARKPIAQSAVARPAEELHVGRSGGSPCQGCTGAGPFVGVEKDTESATAAPRLGAKCSAKEYSPAVSAHVSSKIGALASALGPASMNFGKAPPRRLLARAEPGAEAEKTDLDTYGCSKAQKAIERRERELMLLAQATTDDEEKQGNACGADDASHGPSLQADPSTHALALGAPRGWTEVQDAIGGKTQAPADVASAAEELPMSGSEGNPRRAVGCSGAETGIDVEDAPASTAAASRSVAKNLAKEYPTTVRARALAQVDDSASALGPACTYPGKTPPRKLPAPGQPSAKGEKIDLDLNGDSKAQEATERRKQEQGPLAKGTLGNEDERRDACGAEESTARIGGSRGVHGGNEVEHESRSPEADATNITGYDTYAVIRGAGDGADVDACCVTHQDQSGRGLSGDAQCFTPYPEQAGGGGDVARQDSSCDGAERPQFYHHTNESTGSTGTDLLSATDKRKRSYSSRDRADNPVARNKNSASGDKSLSHSRDETCGAPDEYDFGSDREAQTRPRGYRAQAGEGSVAFDSDVTATGCSSSGETQPQQ